MTVLGIVEKLATAFGVLEAVNSISQRSCEVGAVEHGDEAEKGEHHRGSATEPPDPHFAGIRWQWRRLHGAIQSEHHQMQEATSTISDQEARDKMFPDNMGHKYRFSEVPPLLDVFFVGLNTEPVSNLTVLEEHLLTVCCCKRAIITCFSMIFAILAIVIRAAFGTLTGLCLHSLADAHSGTPVAAPER